MYRKWYPPTRFVFHPLYRVMRRRFRAPVSASYLAVWIISGGLHGALFLVFGRPVGAAVFFLIFVALGLVGVGAIASKNRRRRTLMDLRRT